MALPHPPPMAVPDVEKQWQISRSIEDELRKRLEQKDPYIDDVERLMQQFRISCELTIFADFEFAASKNVETHLWDAHTSINSRYRKILTNLKSDESKKHVEKRKWQKRYADFIKGSQFFYKGYIQRLASRYQRGTTGPLAELRKIAHQLDPLPGAPTQQIQVSEWVAKAILLSCHATLLHLGDLSRYRNEIRTKDRSWDVAMQYYGLANDLNPDSGSAFNQMAVIALSDSAHLDAVYYLYRSLAANEPHPVGRKNLEIEFKKITADWNKEKGGRRVHSRHANSIKERSDNLAPLTSWFVRLHAKLYKGEDFAGHDELENEVLSQMTVLLKEQSLEAIMNKLVLINIAAEYFAGERLKETQSDANFQSFYFFLRLNVRMLFMLLQLLQPELEDPSTKDSIPSDGFDAPEHRSSISAVARRVLPALRQYSIWLVSRATILASQSDNRLLDVHVKQLWQIYATTLTMMVNVFHVEQLPVMSYLLEEDQETVGFKPFHDKDLAPQCDIYEDENGALKARLTDPGVSRSHPNLEMQARIRDILKDGVKLACDEQCPLSLVDGQFYYAEDGLAVSSITTESPAAKPLGESRHDDHSATATAPLMAAQIRDIHPAPSVAASDSHQSLGSEAHQMVDDLVDGFSDYSRTKYNQDTPRQSFSGHAFHAPKQRSFAPDVSPHPLASLPGIYNSPFTPRPHELSIPSPDRPLSARDVSSQSSSRFQSSSDLFGSRSLMYETSPQNLWGQHGTTAQARRNSRQDVMQELQSSLLHSFQQTSLSSPIHNSASTYNTALSPPATGHRNESFDAGRLAGSYERYAMLNSSPWTGSQTRPGQMPTPPGGQGG